jgi:hypothetical protein
MVRQITLLKAREVLAAVLALAVFLPGFAFGASADTPRIVVIGEVQSAANTVRSFLEHVELIDAEANWTGGNSILIQTGDFMDDGEHVRATLDLFMRLQKEAEAAGGQVIVLMGNHEALNIMGDCRWVNYMAYESFKGPDSEQLQLEAWEAWVAWRQKRASSLGEGFEPTAEVKAEWFALHPPGWAEYAESMRPAGVYGAWLRTLPVAVVIDDVLFVHSGISPELETMGVEELNRRAAEEIKYFDDHREFMVTAGLGLPTSSILELVEVVKQEVEFINGLKASKRTKDNPRVAQMLQVQDLSKCGDWIILDKNGPLYFTGEARWPEEEFGGQLAHILDAQGIKRIVTGQSDGKHRLVQSRFDDRVVLTSIGMSDDPYAGGGKPAALEILNYDYFVVSLDGRELLIDN